MSTCEFWPIQEKEERRKKENDDFGFFSQHRFLYFYKAELKSEDRFVR